MGDLWLVRLDDVDGPVYLYEADAHTTVLVPYPEDAKTYSNAAARRAAREHGGTPVRRFEELRR